MIGRRSAKKHTLDVPHTFINGNTGFVVNIGGSYKENTSNRLYQTPIIDHVSSFITSNYDLWINLYVVIPPLSYIRKILIRFLRKHTTTKSIEKNPKVSIIYSSQTYNKKFSSTPMLFSSVSSVLCCFFNFIVIVTSFPKSKIDCVILYCLQISVVGALFFLIISSCNKSKKFFSKPLKTVAGFKRYAKYRSRRYSIFFYVLGRR